MYIKMYQYSIWLYSMDINVYHLKQNDDIPWKLTSEST